MRHALTLRAVLGSLGLAGAARAQSCHEAPPAEPAVAGVRLALRGETAGFETERYEGHYESLAARATLRAAWLEASAALPAYRLVRNGAAVRGLGDLLLWTRARLLGAPESAGALGGELGASLPTGDAEHELGMGHVMLMPGVWWTLRAPRLVLSGRVGSAGAVGAAAGHHHHAGGASPLVDPMNASEGSAALTASYELSRVLVLRTGTYGAVPYEAEGAARAAVFTGAMLRAGRFSTSIDVHLPVAGDAFEQKLALELSARF